MVIYLDYFIYLFIDLIPKKVFIDYRLCIVHSPGHQNKAVSRTGMVSTVIAQGLQQEAYNLDLWSVAPFSELCVAMSV